MPIPGGKVDSGLMSPAAVGSLTNSLFVRNGMAVWWWPAKACECWGEFMERTAESGGPDPNCPSCGGRGFQYPERLMAQGPIFTGMQHQTEWSEAGMTFTGGVVMTVPYIDNLPTLTRLYNELGLRDIIVCTDFEFEAPFHVKRGVDVLPYRPTQVMEITWNGLPYRSGLEYVVSGRTVAWVGNKPPVDENYLVRMSYYPFYTVMESLAVLRNYANVQWPRKYLLEEDPNLSDIVVSGD